MFVILFVFLEKNKKMLTINFHIFDFACHYKEVITSNFLKIARTVLSFCQ